MENGRAADFAFLKGLGCAFQTADLAFAGNVTAVPFHPEIEIPLGKQAGRIDREFAQDTSPFGPSITNATCLFVPFLFRS